MIILSYYVGIGVKLNVIISIIISERMYVGLCFTVWLKIKLCIYDYVFNSVIIEVEW